MIPRPALAVGLVAAWVAATIGGFWHYEFRFLRPIARPSDVPVVSAGSQIEALALKPVEGGALRLEPGKPWLVHFWSPDCPCSRFNEPYIQALSRDYTRQGVRFVGVIESVHPVTPDTVARARQALPFPVVVDANHAIAKRFGVFASPSACLIDRKGHVHFSGTYNTSAFCHGQHDDLVQTQLLAMLADKKAPETGQLAFGCAIR